MKIKTIYSRGAGLGVMLLLFAGCYSVPVTGRSGINLVSDEAVVEMSVEQFNLLKAQYPQTRNRKYIDMVRRVGERIADVARHDILNPQWEFVVFEDPGSLNAFAMAGGKVGVFTDIFKIVKTEDDLAIVLGHEIAHVSAKHVNERLSKQMMVQGMGLGLGVATMGTTSIARSVILDAYGLGSSLGGLGFNRKMETEADYIGLMYAARSGYNPEAAYGLWERMASESQTSAPPEFLSTHPSHGSRVSHLRDIMPEAVAEYNIVKGGGYSTESSIIVIE